MAEKTVFISYSHDSDEHCERVLALSTRLRADGIKTLLDQYVNGSPQRGWPRWMLDQLDAADYVLVVCSETYYRRFRGHEEPGRGKGVDWEGALITQEIYDDRSQTLKFVPVLLTAAIAKWIHEPMRSVSHHALTSESAYERLYDFLLEQAGVEPQPVGALKTKSRRKGTVLTFDEPARSETAKQDIPRIAPCVPGEPFGPDEAIDQDQAKPQATTSKAAISYDPRNPPFFVPYRQKGDQVIGREVALEKVRQQLTAGRQTAIGQTAVFQGLGGLGKTQLAVEYAYHYRAAYPNGVIWLTADQDLDAQLIDLAVKAHWVAPASEHRLKLEVALHRLRSYSGCLIIFDNLEQLAAITAYLPEPPAEPHILVTSRSEQPDFTSVPIDVLSPDESLRMLTQEASRQPEAEPDWAAAREIARTLGGLPLALELAGAYLSRRPVSWQGYLEMLQHNLRLALPPRLASLTGHDADLYSTLQVSESVIAEEPRLRDILDVLTWSGPAPMGRDLLATLVGAADKVALTNALGLGTALRILQQVPDTDSYALHRLVREVRREQSPLADRPGWTAVLCRRIGDWFSSLREDFVQLPRFEAEIDHLREWHDHSLTFAPQQASRLTWLQAYPPFHRSQHQEIKRLVELALIEYDQHGCDDRPLLAHLDNDLAYSLGGRGNLKRALELAEQALAIRRELFGEPNRDTARSLHNVASYTNALGNPKRALELAEQALAVRLELFGERHPDTALSLINLAVIAHALGNPKRALELAEQALAIYYDLFGERHPDTARSLDSVAFYTNSLGDPKRALELAEQALTIRRQLFGERHPETAHSLSRVARYTNAMRNPKRALELAEQALTIRRELFGERHPETARSLGDIATITNDLGDPKRALEMAEQALEIRRELFGEHYREMAISLTQVAIYTNAMGNSKRALGLAEQSLAIRRELFVESHPDTAACLHNKASILRSLGKNHQAYACAKEAFEIEKLIFGLQHPSTLNTAKLLKQIERPGFRRPPGAGKRGHKKKGRP